MNREQLLSDTADAFIAFVRSLWTRRSLGTDSQAAAEADPDFWGFQTLMTLAGDTPEAAWELIGRVLECDAQWRVLSLLSAGPLQQLLRSHGAAFIDRVESAAKNDPEFARLLGGLAEEGLDPNLWSRIKAVQDVRGWENNPEIA